MRKGVEGIPAPCRAGAILCVPDLQGLPGVLADQDTEAPDRDCRVQEVAHRGCQVAVTSRGQCWESAGWVQRALAAVVLPSWRLHPNDLGSSSRCRPSARAPDNGVITGGCILTLGWIIQLWGPGASATT